MVVEMATTMRVMSSHVAVQRRFSLLISSRNFLSRNIDTLPIQGRNLRFVISYGVTKHHLMYTKSEHMMRFSSRRTVARAMATPAAVDSVCTFHLCAICRILCKCCGGGVELQIAILIAPLSWTFLLLALPYRVESSDIVMRPKTGQSLVSPHSRIMRSPLRKHFQQN
jgi:hypothetical protein